MEGATTAVEKVNEVIPSLFSLANTCFDAVVANPILLLYFAVGMIGIGLGVFSMLKNTARG